MKTFLHIFLFPFLFTGFISAQNECISYLPDEGTTLVYNNLDKKGKISSTTTTKVVSVVKKFGAAFVVASIKRCLDPFGFDRRSCRGGRVAKVVKSREVNVVVHPRHKSFLAQ